MKASLGEFWAFVTADGNLLPSTIREREGDARSAFEKTDAKYRDQPPHRLVRVLVTLKPQP